MASSTQAPKASQGTASFSFLNVFLSAVELYHAVFDKNVKNRAKKIITSGTLMVVSTTEGVISVAFALAKKYIPGISLFASIVDFSRRYRIFKDNEKELALAKILHKNHVAHITEVSQRLEENRKKVGYGMFYVACAVMMLVPPLYYVGLVFSTAAWAAESREKIRATSVIVAQKVRLAFSLVKEALSNIFTNVTSALKSFVTKKPVIVPTAPLVSVALDNAPITASPVRVRATRSVEASLRGQQSTAASMPSRPSAVTAQAINIAGPVTIAIPVATPEPAVVAIAAKFSSRHLVSKLSMFSKVAVAKQPSIGDDARPARTRSSAAPAA